MYVLYVRNHFCPPYWGQSIYIHMYVLCTLDLPWTSAQSFSHLAISKKACCCDDFFLVQKTVFLFCTLTMLVYLLLYYDEWGAILMKPLVNKPEVQLRSFTQLYYSRHPVLVSALLLVDSHNLLAPTATLQTICERSRISLWTKSISRCPRSPSPSHQNIGQNIVGQCFCQNIA